MEPRTDSPAWGPAKRFLFRFVFAYSLLYILPFPLDVLPYIGLIAAPYHALWAAIVPWVGTNVFHVDASVFPNGSGDTTFNYVQLFCYLVIAAVVTIVWTLLDRKRSNYARLHEGLRAYVRLWLATVLLGYGAFKVIQSQFPAPSFDRLLQPIGDSSPMGLLWTFMGASKAYNVFTGLAEMLGGLLLVSRRTALLGALVCLGVMGNVVMLNFCYDVPVKIYSSHLLAGAVLLAVPGLRRLTDVFLFHRAVEPAEHRPLFESRWLHWSALVLRTVLIAGSVSLSLFVSYQNSLRYADRASKTPLYGIWEVDEFELDGRIVPPRVTDPVRWRRVVFDFPGVLAVQLMSQSRERYNLELDPAKKTMTLTRRDDPTSKHTVSYRQPAAGRLAIEGNLEGRRLRATLHRSDGTEFLLVSRGFHWINERPFNH